MSKMRGEIGKRRIGEDILYVCVIKRGQQVEARTHSPLFITTIITIHLCNYIT